MRRTAVKSKLTLWVDKETKQFGKAWAKQHHESLSKLVSDYLDRLKTTGKPSPLGPMVSRLSALLKGRRPDIASYRKYLEKKYLNT